MSGAGDRTLYGHGIICLGAADVMVFDRCHDGNEGGQSEHNC